MKKHLSIEDIEELIEISEDEKVKKFWQTIKSEKMKGSNSRFVKSWFRRFLSVPVYNTFVVIIFVFALISFGIWFLLNYTDLNISTDITQIAPIIAFAFISLIFYRYITDKEEIFSLIGELADYSIQNESVFENIGIGLIVIDATCKVIKVNRRAEEILEARSYELIGKNCENIFYNKELGKLLVNTIRIYEEVKNIEINIRSSKGHNYYLQVTTSLLQNKKGDTIGAIELINDITEIRELQEKLKLNEHLASIGELSAKLGHEIGNSLGGIRLFTDNLLEELPQEDHRREYALEILSEIDRLKSGISDLKNYSKPINLELKKTNVNKLLDDAILSNTDKIQNNGIIIHKNYNMNLPEIMIDGDKIKGAILNIIINAIQAMPHGGTLGISTKSWNGSLELSISDTGVGIPPEIYGKIFNPFFTTKKLVGTGLGLSIAYKAIKSHGGNIKFNSEVGKGTTFSVELPVNITINEQC